MYLHLVGVLEHTILTFISRTKPHVAGICNRKTATRLLLDMGKANCYTCYWQLWTKYDDEQATVE